MNVDLNILKEMISSENNEKKVIELKNIFTKKYIQPLYEELKKAQDKKTFGLYLNDLKNQVDAIILDHLNKVNSLNDQCFINDDCCLNTNSTIIGNKHLINTIIDEIAHYLMKYNFNIVNGNEITTDHYNFEALNIDKNHPARGTHDTLYLTSNLLLRTHCTSTTAIYLREKNKSDDIRVFSYGNVYRKDEDDATHSHQFTQVDLVWVRKDLSLTNLKSLIDGLINYLFNEKLKTRYRLSYFPFTEPSFEVDVECWKCKNQGCNICKQSGWIEILGAGMLNQKVITAAGIKHINTGLAAGIGIERIAMLKYNISDIRDLYNNDFDVLKQFVK